MSGLTERRDDDLIRDPGATMSLAIALLASVAGLTVLVEIDTTSPPVLFDVDTWWRGLTQPPAGSAHDLGRLLAFVGSGWVMIPARLVVGIWLAVCRWWIGLVAWLSAWMATALVTGGLKAGVGRLRPDLSETVSFPSGHASTAAQVAVGLVLVTIPPNRSRKWGWVAAGAWIVAMSLSRTVIDVHWASDVIAGTLLGVGAMLMAAAAAQRRR
jgi:membrane-associated phospholipid phosphatase